MSRQKIRQKIIDTLLYLIGGVTPINTPTTSVTTSVTTTPTITTPTITTPTITTPTITTPSEHWNFSSPTIFKSSSSSSPPPLISLSLQSSPSHKSKRRKIEHDSTYTIVDCNKKLKFKKPQNIAMIFNDTLELLKDQLLCKTCKLNWRDCKKNPCENPKQWISMKLLKIGNIIIKCISEPEYNILKQIWDKNIIEKCNLIQLEPYISLPKDGWITKFDEGDYMGFSPNSYLIAMPAYEYSSLRSLYENIHLNVKSLINIVKYLIKNLKCLCKNKIYYTDFKSVNIVCNLLQNNQICLKLIDFDDVYIIGGSRNNIVQTYPMITKYNIKGSRTSAKVTAGLIYSGKEKYINHKMTLISNEYIWLNSVVENNNDIWQSFNSTWESVPWEKCKGLFKINK